MFFFTSEGTAKKVHIGKYCEKGCYNLNI